jgi:peroxiredoxin
LDGFAENADAFAALNTTIIAASVDDQEKTKELAEGKPFPLAYGVTKEQVDLLGAWWDGNRNFMQPSEFILNHKGRVVHSTYSSSPVGRIDPAEAQVMIKFISSR